MTQPNDPLSMAGAGAASEGASEDSLERLAAEQAAAAETAARRIVALQARGNVALQSGLFTTDAEAYAKVKDLAKYRF